MFERIMRWSQPWDGIVLGMMEGVNELGERAPLEVTALAMESNHTLLIVAIICGAELIQLAMSLFDFYTDY
jgi:hypothetical protein